MRSNPSSIRPSSPGHEKIVTRLTSVFIIVASVVLMLVVCLVSTRVIFHRYAQKRPMQSMQPLGILTAPDNQPLKHFPTPSLELDDGHADSTALRERQLKKLNSYAWADRSNRIVTIPIERAMDLIALHGLPVATNFQTTNSLQFQASQEGALP